MITIVMSKSVRADAARVWRALTDMSERTAWDEPLLSAVDVPSDYPYSGQHVRWRYQLGSVRVVLHDRPLEVSPPTRFKQAVSVGSLRYEQTFTLGPEPGLANTTRLSMKVVARNSVPVLGETVDRFSVRQMASEHVARTLSSIEHYFDPEGTTSYRTPNDV